MFHFPQKLPDLQFGFPALMEPNSLLVLSPQRLMATSISCVRVGLESASLEQCRQEAGSPFNINTASLYTVQPGHQIPHYINPEEFGPAQPDRGLGIAQFGDGAEIDQGSST